MPSGAFGRSSARPRDGHIDPWRRMSCVPPSAAMPLQSDLPPAPFSTTSRPMHRGSLPWTPSEPATLAAVIASPSTRHSSTPARISGSARKCSPDATDPTPPTEGWLNKAGGRKKRLFLYPPIDELLFRVVNRLMQPAAVEAASPWCSVLPPGRRSTSRVPTCARRSRTPTSRPRSGSTCATTSTRSTCGT